MDEKIRAHILYTGKTRLNASVHEKGNTQLDITEMKMP